jgi:predicted GH43/DUF377 family glycosyl hydrolase
MVVGTVATLTTGLEFKATRLGVIMRPEAGQPHEAWGVLNPGGVRAGDGTMQLFPRLIAEGNYSRIGRARVRFDAEKPFGVERLGVALAPHETYEVNAGGGGVEDPRVVFVPLLGRYVMTYTAFIPYEPRVAVAVSTDLVTWQRLGCLRFDVMADGCDLNTCGNKDAAFFPEVVSDPQGVPSFAILHRPTTRLHYRRHHDGTKVVQPPSGDETQEHIWISYVAANSVLADIANLTAVRRHEPIMAPEQLWETKKVGTGAPPMRVNDGWLLTYHAVSAPNGHSRYCMGVAILDAERPARVRYRSPSPILEPHEEYERNGLVNEVIFPSATDRRADGAIDVYYGAADHVIAVARLTMHGALPTGRATANGA